MTVRIGFIGAGGNANWHMDSLANVPDAEVVAITDLDAAKAKAATEKHGGVAYESHKAMLAKAKLDCCYISVPPHQHGEPEIDVIQTGMPFFVEKPLSTRMELVDDIAERIAAKDIKTCVGYQIRYLDICDTVRELVKDTQVNAVLAHYVGGCIGGWYSRIALSGGQVVEQATHLVDMMRFCLGDVKTVSALKRTGAVVDESKLDGTVLGKGSVSSEAAGLSLHEYNIWDATSALMEFRNGIPATFMCSCQTPYMWDVLMDIFATDFRLKVTFGGLDIYRKVGHELKIEHIDDSGTRNIDATFVNAVKTSDFSQVRSNYADAMETLRVTLAIKEAAETGRIVAL